MKLFEYTALIKVVIVVAAESEEIANKEIQSLSAEGWIRTGEIIGLVETDDLLFDVRESDGITREQLEDEAHIIVGVEEGD